MTMARKRTEVTYTNTTGDMQKKDKDSNMTKDEEEPMKATRINSMPTYK